ncbi:MAG TPA: rod shape-determining protein MreD [Acidobacteriota bacterium]|nr:rod shape-determining protein MreD [Acidobacteriota bacterium]
MKYLFLAMASFMAVIVQMISGNYFFLFNFFDLALLLVAYWAVYHSRIQALFVGSLVGILLDAALGWPLGYNGFGKTLAAFIIGQCWKRFNTVGQLWVRFLIIAAASLISSSSIFFLFWFMQQSPNRIFLGASVLQALITAGAGLVLFLAIDAYKRMQTLKPVE